MSWSRSMEPLRWRANPVRASVEKINLENPSLLLYLLPLDVHQLHHSFIQAFPGFVTLVSARDVAHAYFDRRAGGANADGGFCRESLNVVARSGLLPLRLGLQRVCSCILRHQLLQFVDHLIRVLIGRNRQL